MRAADANHAECIETLVKRSVQALFKEATQLHLNYFMSDAFDCPVRLPQYLSLIVPDGTAGMRE